jgi:DNA-binding HxlR family transcriptional regulator
VTTGEPGVTTPDAPRGDLFSPACPTRLLLDRLGTKWTSMVVKSLAESGEMRFGALRRQVSGVSPKMLSTTLQSLVLDGLVARRVEDTVPPRVHYRLTELGLSLEIPLALLREWAEEHMGEIDRRRHGDVPGGRPGRPAPGTR